MGIVALYQQDYAHIMKLRSKEPHLQNKLLREQVAKLKEHRLRIEYWLERNAKHAEWMSMAQHRTLVIGVLDTKFSITLNIDRGRPTHGHDDVCKPYDTRNGLPFQSK